MCLAASFDLDATSSVALHGRLEQSRNHHQERGITGLLIYRDREFMQLVEAEQTKVLSLCQRTECGPRYWQVHTIREGPVAASTCGDWAMGCAGRDDATLQALPNGRLAPEAVPPAL
jgi:hypothetical protein